MKFLSDKELQKLVIEDFQGNNYRWFTFKLLTNAPKIRVSKKTNHILNCTCKQHSIYGIDKDCRYNSALRYLLENKIPIPKNE